MENPLTTTSIILHLEIRKWGGEVTDKKALKAVSDAFKSDTHNDKYTKSLFVTDPLSLINRCAGRLRNHFYAMTVPWLDNGKGRLIPSMSFQEFALKHTEIKQQFYQEVEAFLTNYEDHKDQAKAHKGDLYNEGEYPTVAQLRTLFEINLTTLPFPDVNDFRVTAPEAVIAELETSIGESIKRVETVVSGELEERFKERLRMLVKTLTVGKRFNKSLLTELRGVIDMTYNLQDTVTEDLLKNMAVVEKNILIYSAEELRNSESRQEVAIEVCTSILA